MGFNLLNKRSCLASMIIFLSFGLTVTQDTYFSMVNFSFFLTKFNKFLELLSRSNTTSVTLKLVSMNLKPETQACHLPETYDFLASLQPYWNCNQRKQLIHLFTLSALTHSLARSPTRSPIQKQKGYHGFYQPQPCALFQFEHHKNHVHTCPWWYPL